MMMLVMWRHIWMAGGLLRCAYRAAVCCAGMCWGGGCCCTPCKKKKNSFFKVDHTIDLIFYNVAAIRENKTRTTESSIHSSPVALWPQTAPPINRSVSCVQCLVDLVELKSQNEIILRTSCDFRRGCGRPIGDRQPPHQRPPLRPWMWWQVNGPVHEGTYPGVI